MHGGGSPQISSWDESHSIMSASGSVHIVSFTLTTLDGGDELEDTLAVGRAEDSWLLTLENALASAWSERSCVGYTDACALDRDRAIRDFSAHISANAATIPLRT